MRPGGLIAAVSAALCVVAPALGATVPATTVHLSVIGMPKTATAGTPFTVRQPVGAKWTDAGTKNVDVVNITLS